MESADQFTAFYSFNRIAAGDLETVLRRAKAHTDAERGGSVLIFDDTTGSQMDFDFSGSVEDVLARVIPSEAPKGRGRPKLGVKCGELCLLPRHWDWLATQPRSASATIRRLVDAARKNETAEERSQQRLAAVGGFMSLLAGDLEDYEEASRALYSRNWSVLDTLSARWPTDVRTYLDVLLAPVRDGTPDLA